MKQLTDALGPDILKWDFDGKTPLRIDAVRKKTGTEYYTFLSRDALEAIRSYLLDKERRTSRKTGPTDRLFKEPKCPAVFTTNMRNLAKRAGFDSQYVEAGGSRFARRYTVHLHGLRALFKTVCNDAGIPEAVSEFLNGRAYQQYHYNHQHGLVDADGNKIGEQHFREMYQKAEPRLNILSGIESQQIEEKIQAAAVEQTQHIQQLRKYMDFLRGLFEI